MAVGNTPQVPRDMRFAIAQQAALGTAVPDAQDYVELDCEPFEVNYNVKQIVFNSSHGKRYKTDNDIITHQKGVMPSFTISGTANHDSIDYFINAFTQNVTETGVSPYVKTFTMHESQPNFNGISAITEVGQLLTIILRDPVGGKSVKCADCIAKGLTLTWAQGEPLKYSAEFVSKDAPSFSSTPSGVWTNVTSGDLYYFEDITIVKIAGTDYHLNSFELALTQEVLPVGQDGSGNFADYAITNRELGFTIKIVKDEDFEALLTAWTGNNAVDIDLKIGTGSTDGDIAFDLHGKFNADTGVQKVYDELMHGEVSGILTETADKVTDPLVITLANDNDRTWVSA